ncbi:TPA: dATP/dGTP pyrophosphohydrolase domain-containing protein [Citrobacter freundii]
MADAVKAIDWVLESIVREQVRREHAAWSLATFGDVGPVGPLKHLSKEALEAAAEPDDLSEWADMQFLLWDAQRRSGISDEQITLAMIEKLAVNKQREWPEPKDGEPRMHIKEQPAPVVPTFDEWLEIRGNKPLGWVKDAMRESYDACRAAMLQAGNSPVIPDGWIPLSERMPDKLIPVMVMYADGEMWSAMWSGQFWDDGCTIPDPHSITHWREMPAAPQQEVKSALEHGMRRYAGAMQKLSEGDD